jgi:hypothetical protein
LASSTSVTTSLPLRENGLHPVAGGRRAVVDLVAGHSVFTTPGETVGAPGRTTGG